MLRKRGALVLLVVLLGPMALAAQEVGPYVGMLAPPFTLKDLEGREVSLEDFRGKGVLLNFWATWCPPCRKEIPALQEFYQTYGDKVVILGINMMEIKVAVARFAEKYGITYPLLLDHRGEVATKYRVRLLPTSFFIDEGGVIREIISGELSLERLAYVFARKVFGSDLIPLGFTAEATAELDADGDGHPEAALLDADGDDRPDGGMIDPNSDGLSDAMAVIFKEAARGFAPLDTVVLKKGIDLETGRLIIQYLSLDLDRDSNPEIRIADRDFDGLPDEISVDYDDNGAVDLKYP
jgi:peroxiredoxin